VGLSSLARTVSAASAAEPDGESAQVWVGCARWASTSAQQDGFSVSDLGGGKPADRHTGAFPELEPRMAVRWAHLLREQQRLSGGLGLIGRLSFGSDRGVIVEDDDLRTILLTCMGCPGLGMIGTNRRRAAPESLPTAGSLSSPSLRREEGE
jgi:hypothetical protein